MKKTGTEKSRDPLNDLTSETHRLAGKARRCFLEGHPTIAYEIIAELYNFLDDEVKSWDRAKCKSNGPKKKGVKP